MIRIKAQIARHNHSTTSTRSIQHPAMLYPPIVLPVPMVPLLPGHLPQPQPVPGDSGHHPQDCHSARVVAVDCMLNRRHGRITTLPILDQHGGSLHNVPDSVPAMAMPTSKTKSCFIEHTNDIIVQCWTG